MSNYVDLNTLAEMDLALASDLNTASNGTLFPSDTRKMALNRSYRKCAALFRWPALEDSKKTTTGIGQYYYDAPTTWRPDSIFRLEVNGEAYGEAPDFSPLLLNDYLNWKAENPTSDDLKWAIQWHRYFFSPTPTVAGLVICIWGQKNITPMTNTTDTTIFSYSMPECNEAVVLEALAILQKKGDKKDDATMNSPEAKLILSVAFNKLKQEQTKFEKLEPMWNVPDYFRGKGTANHPTGGFNLR